MPEFQFTSHHAIVEEPLAEYFWNKVALLRVMICRTLRYCVSVSPMKPQNLGLKYAVKHILHRFERFD